MCEIPSDFISAIGLRDQKIISQLIQYHDLLADYNTRVNLISRKDSSFIWQHHIYPSLAAMHMCPIQPGATVLDFGTGAGLPGVILKIARPDLNLLLVDSIGKKIRFLDYVISKLALSNTQAFYHRLTSENPISKFEGKVNVVTVRAVSRLEAIYRDCHKMMAPDGYYLAWKGASDLPDLQALLSKYPLSAHVFRPDENLSAFSRRIESLLLFKISRIS